MDETSARRVAIVTGAASGIGRAIAGVLATSNMDVVMVDRDGDALVQAAAELESNDDRVVSAEVDVTRASDVEALVARVLTERGRIDLLVNSAGIGMAALPFAQIDEAVFDAVIATNLKGVFLFMRAVLPALAERGGTIVNIASALGLVARPDCAAYVAAKHAVIGLTRTAAVEYAAQGVRINAICPGIIRTPLAAAAWASEAAHAASVAIHPMGRLGVPDEVAAAALWLATSAPAAMTGSVLTVDGGWTA